MDSFAKFLQEKLNEKAEKTRREEIERQQWNKNINDTYYLIDSWLSDYKAFGLKTEIDTENRHMTIDFLDKKATLQAVDRLMHSQLMISDAECLMEIERKVVRYLGAAYCCDESGDPYGKAICPDCYINNQKISTLSDERPNRKCGSCSTKFNYFDTPLISDYSDIKARLKRLKKEMIPVVL